MNLHMYANSNIICNVNMKCKWMHFNESSQMSITFFNMICLMNLVWSNTIKLIFIIYNTRRGLETDQPRGFPMPFCAKTFFVDSFFFVDNRSFRWTCILSDLREKGEESFFPSSLTVSWSAMPVLSPVTGGYFIQPSWWYHLIPFSMTIQSQHCIILFAAGLHEMLALLTSQLHPEANHKEDLVFLREVFSERSLSHLMKVCNAWWLYIAAVIMKSYISILHDCFSRIIIIRHPLCLSLTVRPKSHFHSI